MFAMGSVTRGWSATHGAVEGFSGHEDMMLGNRNPGNQGPSAKSADNHRSLRAWITAARRDRTWHHAPGNNGTIRIECEAVVCGRRNSDHIV